MKLFKSHFWYTKSQRNGIFVLLAIILGFQMIIFSSKKKQDFINLETNEVIAFQNQIDSLKAVEIERRRPKIFPFNPNFISDYKGNQLGMSVSEINRLHVFRKGNKFVNSAKEFQEVTQVSDSLLRKISPYFKFPEWVTKQKGVKKNDVVPSFNNKIEKTKSLISTRDINKATKMDFQAVKGVNQTLAERIVAYREKLSGFTFSSQLYEVWNLDKSTADKILETFKVDSKPTIQKININTASFKEVLAIAYIDYDLCKKIFDYRDEVAELQSISELKNIKDFPLELYDRIVLYLFAE